MLTKIADRFWHTRTKARVPEGQRYYVVGDIHGRFDLLCHLHSMILADYDATLAPINATVVFLGDYVDRGSDSKQVIEFLNKEPFTGFRHKFLLGNHEQAFIDFLDNPEIGGDWFRFGGEATVESYGAIKFGEYPRPDKFRQISDDLQQMVPIHHQQFLRGLNLTHEAGDYLFVHAGIYPGVPLEKQHRDDLIWIREDFLKSRRDHGKIIVHGHSIAGKPEIRKNRIGIDTGAYATDKLTCLVLEGRQRRFLQTK